MHFHSHALAVAYIYDNIYMYTFIYACIHTFIQKCKHSHLKPFCMIGCSSAAEQFQIPSIRRTNLNGQACLFISNLLHALKDARQATRDAAEHISTKELGVIHTCMSVSTLILC